MRHDEDGRTVEVGARTRTIPPALRRALHARDRGCRFPGCGLPFGQGHHVRHWAHGGPTTLVEPRPALSPAPSRGPRRGLSGRSTPDGALQFRRPDGRLLPEVPPPAAVPADPVQALRSGTTRRGCASTRGRRARPGWGASGRGVGDRRAASARDATRGIVPGERVASFDRIIAPPTDGVREVGGALSRHIASPDCADDGSPRRRDHPSRVARHAALEEVQVAATLATGPPADDRFVPADPGARGTGDRRRRGQTRSARDGKPQQRSRGCRDPSTSE